METYLEAIWSVMSARYNKRRYNREFSSERISQAVYDTGATVSTRGQRARDMRLLCVQRDEMRRKVGNLLSDKESTRAAWRFFHAGINLRAKHAFAFLFPR